MSHAIEGFVEQALLGTDLAGGIESTFRFGISTIQLQNGLMLNPPAAGVTVVIGPNNAGKSTLLREINEHLRAEPNSLLQPLIVKGLDAPIVCQALSSHVR